MRDLPCHRWLNVAVAILVVLLLIALLLPAIRNARDTARRTQSRNNLHQLALAFHNYHDAFECLPPGAVIAGDGTPLHGWFVHALPFIDANPFSNWIDKGQPWDDPWNQCRFRRELPVCLIPGAAESSTPEGFGLLHYPANPNVFHRNSAVRFEDLKAGLASTWLLGEADRHALPWSYPFNWRPLGTQLNAGPETFGRPTRDGAFLAMADGSVRFITNDVGADVLQKLAQALPLATAEQTAQPPRPDPFPDSGWNVERVPLESVPRSSELVKDWDDNQVELILNADRVPERVSIWGFEQTSAEAAVREVATRFPQMRRLSTGVVIDDHVASALVPLANLEGLKATGLDLSDSGMEDLASLPKLRRVILSEVDDETLEALKASLPGCRIETGSPGDLK